MGRRPPIFLWRHPGSRAPPEMHAGTRPTLPFLPAAREKSSLDTYRELSRAAVRFTIPAGSPASPPPPAPDNTPPDTYFPTKAANGRRTRERDGLRPRRDPPETLGSALSSFLVCKSDQIVRFLRSADLFPKSNNRWTARPTNYRDICIFTLFSYLKLYGSLLLRFSRKKVGNCEIAESMN